LYGNSPQMSVTPDPAPTEPISPVYLHGELAVSVSLDLTFYLERLEKLEFEAAIRCFADLLPSAASLQYWIYESTEWESWHRPVVFPPGFALDRTRWRFAEKLPIEFRLWDGRERDSWSLHCWRSKKDENGVRHSFVRLLAPCTAGGPTLRAAALRLMPQLDLLSMHGGYTFLYDTFAKEQCFGQIHALAKRYWGIDVEDLNATLPSMRHGLKSVSWLTGVGDALMRQRPTGMPTLDNSAPMPEQLDVGSARLWIAGPGPALIDKNRAWPGIQPYEDVARLLQDLFANRLPTFAGRFDEHETAAWQRRFVDRAGW
jgi:hypothetical protein